MERGCCHLPLPLSDFPFCSKFDKDRQNYSKGMQDLYKKAGETLLSLEEGVSLLCVICKAWGEIVLVLNCSSSSSADSCHEIFV